MQRNGFDPKVMDYTWKQNRLSRDKEALKASVKMAIDKKKAEEDKRKIDPNSHQMREAQKILNNPDPKEKAKKDAIDRAEFKKQMMRK